MEEIAQGWQLDCKASKGDNNMYLQPSYREKNRIRWMGQLEEEFMGAVNDLGGIFQARPQAVVDKLHSLGRIDITHDQVKSHLQHLRNKTKVTKEQRESVEEEKDCACSTPDFSNVCETTSEKCDTQNHGMYGMNFINNMLFSGLSQLVKKRITTSSTKRIIDHYLDMKYKDEVTVAAVRRQLQDETMQFLDKNSHIQRLAKIPSLDVFQEAVMPIPRWHPLFEPLKMAAKVHCIYGLVKEFEIERERVGLDWVRMRALSYDSMNGADEYKV